MKEPKIQALFYSNVVYADYSAVCEAIDFLGKFCGIIISENTDTMFSVQFVHLIIGICTDRRHNTASRNTDKASLQEGCASTKKIKEMVLIHIPKHKSAFRHDYDSV